MAVDTKSKSLSVLNMGVAVPTTLPEGVASIDNSLHILRLYAEPAAVTQELAGAATGTGRTTGNLVTPRDLAGAATGTGQLSGDLSVDLTVYLGGAVSGTGQIFGDLDIGDPTVYFSGSVEGEGQLAGDLEWSIGISGAARGEGRVTGDLVVPNLFTGAVAGMGRLAGNLTIPASYLEGKVAARTAVWRPYAETAQL